MPAPAKVPLVKKLLGKKRVAVSATQFWNSKTSASFLESNNHIPFDIKSTSIITDLCNYKNSNELKKKNNEFLVVLLGSLTVKVVNGNLDEIFILNKPNIGLYISRKLESNFIKFSPNAILLVLRSGSNEK